jgi:hypothetical protein
MHNDAEHGEPGEHALALALALRENTENTQNTGSGTISRSGY